MKLIDRTGMRFGRLVVLGKFHKPAASSRSLWECKCDCGTIKVINSSSLKTTNSCGCLRLEMSRALGANKSYIAKRSGINAGAYKHGCKSRSGASPEYKVWIGMKRRCYDASFKDYPNWGGRGVRICERWNSSFENFLSDMGTRPSKLHSIDRIDSAGNYEPGNCRWATPDVQGSNTRSCRSITVEGVEYKTMKDAALAHGIGITTLHQRIKSGMSIERAFSKQRLSRWH